MTEQEAREIVSKYNLSKVDTATLYEIVKTISDDNYEIRRYYEGDVEVELGGDEEHGNGWYFQVWDQPAWWCKSEREALIECIDFMGDH